MAKIVDLATHPCAFVTVQELAEYLRVDEATIYRHIDKGALIVVRLGVGDGRRCIRIPISEARRYVGVAAGEPGLNGPPHKLHRPTPAARVRQPR